MEIYMVDNSCTMNICLSHLGPGAVVLSKTIDRDQTIDELVGISNQFYD